MCISILFLQTLIAWFPCGSGQKGWFSWRFYVPKRPGWRSSESCFAKFLSKGLWLQEDWPSSTLSKPWFKVFPNLILRIQSGLENSNPPKLNCSSYTAPHIHRKLLFSFQQGRRTKFLWLNLEGYTVGFMTHWPTQFGISTSYHKTHLIVPHYEIFVTYKK